MPMLIISTGTGSIRLSHMAGLSMAVRTTTFG